MTPTRRTRRFHLAGRFVTGIRNAEGFAIDPAGHHLFVTQHGRDQLHTNWPDLYKPDEEATLPAEELLHLKESGDYGWPECYYDSFQRKLVLAPEYGGDGGKKQGSCGDKIAPVAAFPAHWAPDGMAFYDKSQFPSRYRSGVFIAFHGSWNRAPFPQSGYNVVFQPLAGDHAAGPCEIFADGFAGPVKSPDGALHRPTGTAVGSDGSLFVSDDVRGRIYKIVYRGPVPEGADPKITPCPSPSRGGGRHQRRRCGPAGRRTSRCRSRNGQPPRGQRRDEKYGRAGRPDLSRSSGWGRLYGLSWVGRHRHRAGSRSDRCGVALERWQLCRYRQDHHRRRGAAQAVPRSDAAQGRRQPHGRSSVSGCRLYLGIESSARARSHRP